MDALIIWKHSKVSSKDINDVICKSISFFLCSYCHSMQRGMNLPLQNCLPLIMKIFWPPPYRAGQASPPSLKMKTFFRSLTSVNFHVTMQASPDPTKNIMPNMAAYLIDQVIINYGEIEKQRQQRPYYIQPNWIILKF